MKTRYYRKEPASDGLVLYRLGRIVLDKHLAIHVAVTQRELEHCRQVVAYRLRRARRELAQIAELVWMELSDAHIERHYGAGE